MNLFMYLEKTLLCTGLTPPSKLLVLFCSFAAAIMMTHPLYCLGVTALILIWGVHSPEVSVISNGFGQY